MPKQMILSKKIVKNGVPAILNIVLEKKSPRPSNKLQPNPNLKYSGMGLAMNTKKRKLG